MNFCHFLVESQKKDLFLLRMSVISRNPCETRFCFKTSTKHRVNFLNLTWLHLLVGSTVIGIHICIQTEKSLI